MIKFVTKLNETIDYTKYLASQLEKELKVKVEISNDYFITIYDIKVLGYVTMLYGIPRLRLWNKETRKNYEIPLSKLDTIYSM